VVDMEEVAAARVDLSAPGDRVLEARRAREEKRRGLRSAPSLQDARDALKRDKFKDYVPPEPLPAMSQTLSLDDRRAEARKRAKARREATGKAVLGSPGKGGASAAANSTANESRFKNYVPPEPELSAGAGATLDGRRAEAAKRREARQAALDARKREEEASRQAALGAREQAHNRYLMSQTAPAGGGEGESNYDRIRKAQARRNPNFKSNFNDTQ